MPLEASSTSRPTSITGGCLCGAIRYTISFPASSPWPPPMVMTFPPPPLSSPPRSCADHVLLPAHHIPHHHSPLCSQNATCQCTLCRKFTGALIAQPVSVPTADIAPPLSSNESYKTYQSSPSGKRGFCGTCGGSLAFCYDKTPGETEIFLGSVDADVLRGEWGKALCETRRHLWLENAVKGVTDGLKGRKYLTDESGEEVFE